MGVGSYERLVVVAVQEERPAGPLDELAASGLGGLGHLLQRCLQTLEMEGSITRGVVKTWMSR
jgi:hypothetical protein